MIPAKPSRLLRAWMGRHVEARIRRTFCGLWLRGFDHLLNAVRRTSCLVVSNHVSWWDPMIAIYLSARLGRFDGYALMDSHGLRRYPFLGRLGGFGIDIRDPADGALGLRYAARLLRFPGRAVWVFPQGGERPSHQRPLGFLPGAAAIERLAPGAAVVPAALRYELADVEKPYAYLAFGAPLEPLPDVDASTRCEAQQTAVTGLLDVIGKHLASPGSDDGFVQVVAGNAPSVAARVAEHLLCWLTRY